MDGGYVSTYQLAGGVVNADVENIGTNGFNGTGKFIQTGGSNSINSSLYLGLNSGSNGNYMLSGIGSISVIGNENVGWNGAETFTQTGGTNTIGGVLFLGNGSSSNGSYTQSGGNTSANYVSVGYGANATGNYMLSGPTNLTVSNNETVGEYGTGYFAQTGGTNTVGGVLFLGYGSSGNGSYTQSGGNTSANYVSVGYGANATGSYMLSGPTSLTVSNNETVGEYGTGHFTQTGGTDTISSSLYVGYASGSTGTYTLSGGTSTVRGSVYVGGSSSGSGGMGSLTVSNTGQLTVTGMLQVYNTGQFNMNGGTVSAAVLNLAGPYTQTAGTATFGQITGNGPVTISGGLTTLTAGGGSSQLSSLVISGTGTLDITKGNELVVNYGTAADPSATIRGYLKSAYRGGVWTGTGLTSSAVEAQVAATIAAHSGGVYAIGYADGSDLAQLPVVAVGHQLVYEPALVGDGNLDGSVTFIDLGIVAQNLGSINSDWEHGDFNYDGTTNFLDIGLLAQNLNKTILNTPLDETIPDPSAALTAQWNLAVAELQANQTQPTNLPEPGMISLMIVGAGGLMARRRRRT